MAIKVFMNKIMKIKLKNPLKSFGKEKFLLFFSILWTCYQLHSIKPKSCVTLSKLVFNHLFKKFENYRIPYSKTKPKNRRNTNLFGFILSRHSTYLISFILEKEKKGILSSKDIIFWYESCSFMVSPSSVSPLFLCEYHSNYFNFVTEVHIHEKITPVESYQTKISLSWYQKYTFLYYDTPETAFNCVSLVLDSTRLIFLSSVVCLCVKKMSIFDIITTYLNTCRKR